MQLTFNDLKPETLQALADDPGFPKELRPQLESLLKSLEIAASFGDGNSFIALCQETAASMKSPKSPTDDNIFE